MEQQEQLVGNTPDSWQDFVPNRPDNSESRVDPLTGLAAIAASRTLETVEPFGTALAVPTPDRTEASTADTSKSTGDKGDGNYDDYHTKDE